MSSVKLKQDGNGNPIPVLSIGSSSDVNDGDYICKAEVVRVQSSVDSRVWYTKIGESNSGSGMLIPAGASVDISVWDGYVLSVQGFVNITPYI